jgi:hypothetical protein
MDNQKRTIMGGLDYTLASLHEIKRELLDVGGERQKIAWAVGGLVVSLMANLMRMIEDVIMKAAENHETASAKDDLTEILKRFTALMNQMLEAGE